MAVYGRAQIVPNISSRKGQPTCDGYTWTMAVSPCRHPFREETRIESAWRYKYIISARKGALRWAQRLGIELLEIC